MSEKRDFASQPRHKYDYGKTALENAVDAYNDLAAHHSAEAEAMKEHTASLIEELDRMKVQYAALLDAIDSCNQGGALAWERRVIAARKELR